MPGLTLTFFGLAAAATHAAAAIAFGSYLCGGNDDDPVHDSNYSRSPHYHRTTRTQTQPSHRPPPETYNRATPRTPASTDPGRGVYHPSVVSPYTRTLIQTQPTSTFSQPSIAKSASTSSRAPSCVPTERDALLSSVIRSASHPHVFSPYTRTPSQTQQPSIVVPPSSSRSQLSTTVAKTSLTVTRPPSTATRPSSTVTQPSSTRTQPSSAVTQPSSSNIQSSSTLTQASRQHLSPINTVHVHEPPEYDFSQARSQVHVPACVHTRNEPPPTVNQVLPSDLRSGEPASVEDLDFAEKLRKLARQRGRDISEALSRAKSAKKKGQKGAAQEHKQEAIAHQKVKKELNERAAKIIFTENNKVCN
jgi:hypothetical protein